jgi:hypothetical protein
LKVYGAKKSFLRKLAAPANSFAPIAGSAIASQQTVPARSAASKCYSSCVESKSNQGGETTANLGAEALKELARRRRRNADKVDPEIGRTRLGQRIFECVFLIGTRSAQSIMASGFTAAQTGRTHDRTRPMLQLRQKVLAKAPSTHDPKRKLSATFCCNAQDRRPCDKLLSQAGLGLMRYIIGPRAPGAARTVRKN